MKNVVIGSGPAGRLASLELGKLGQEVILIEKNHIAGTCLNEGCMVICALTDITNFLDTNRKFNDYGFIKSQMDFSYDKIVEKIKETQIKLRKINEMENNGAGNEIIYGEASIDESMVYVNNESFNYDKLLVATGARADIPNIPGNQHALTNKDILKLDNVPETLNIIGGGIIACEIANIFNTLGTKVNIFPRNLFLKEIDMDIKEYIIKKLLKNVKIFENTDILEIKKNKVITKDNEFEGTAFFATGRKPNSEIVEGVVDLNKNGSINVNQFMQTSNENIYAAGDVTGGYNLTPVARMEGIIASHNMAGYLEKIDYSCIPQSITLSNPVSFVKNEKFNGDLKEIKIPAIAGPNSFWNVLSGDTGLSKISFNEKENKIEKITSISPSSVSDVAYLSYLMRVGIDLNNFDEFLEIHPSTDTNYKIIKSLWL